MYHGKLEKISATVCRVVVKACFISTTAPIDPNEKWCDEEFKNSRKSINERFDKL